MSEIENFLGFSRPRRATYGLLTTFVLTVFVDLTVAVQVGIVLAALLFIKRMAEVTNVGVVTRELQGNGEDDSTDPNAIAKREVPPGVEVFEIQGPFFFGAADRFKESVGLMKSPSRS